MRTRLFHTVVLVGTTLGASLATTACGGAIDSSTAACSGDGCDAGDAKGDVADSRSATSADSGADSWPGIGFDSGTSDTWPGIMPAMIDSGTDTWPGIMPVMLDSGTDTWPGIMTPAIDSGADTWPGIMPPPAPDSGADTWPGIK